MRRYLRHLVLVICLSFVVLSANRVSAHELLPKQLQQYIQDHPNASVEEIQSFIENQNDPVLKDKFRNKEDVINLIKNKNTNFFDNWIDFLKLGIKHILSGPDHILFVLSLLLVFASVKEILKLTGTFTVAHSITLVLAGTGVLTLSSRIVEPFIALSIAYVAITTVFLKDKPFFRNKHNKLGSVFFFGLFHGLGFAGLLQEISLPKDRYVSSLFGFNIGIELGQLVIVAITLPLLYATRGKPWHDRLIQVISVIIATLGIIWAIQRVFF